MKTLGENNFVTLGANAALPRFPYVPTHAGLLACEFAPNGKKIVSASYDKKIEIWDVASGPCQATLKGHRHRYLCLSAPLRKAKPLDDNWFFQTAGGQPLTLMTKRGRCLFPRL